MDYAEEYKDIAKMCRKILYRAPDFVKERTEDLIQETALNLFMSKMPRTKKFISYALIDSMRLIWGENNTGKRQMGRVIDAYGLSLDKGPLDSHESPALGADVLLDSALMLNLFKKRLNTTQLELIELFYFEGMKKREIGKKLNVTESTICQRVKRIEKKVAEFHKQQEARDKFNGRVD